MNKACLFPLILILVLTNQTQAQLRAIRAYKHEVAVQVAQNWIEVGVEQYKRGFYKQAEKSLLQAEEYQKYLPITEKLRLSELLRETCTAIVGKASILEHQRAAEELVGQGELIKAKAHLEKIKGSKFLTGNHRRQVAQSIKQLNTRINEQKKHIAEIYKRSVKLYDLGQFDKAREGLVKVARNGLLTVPEGKTAEDYLLKIDEILTRQAQQQMSMSKSRPDSPVEVIVVEPEADDNLPADIVAEPVTNTASEVVDVTDAEPVTDENPPMEAELVTGKSRYIEVVSRKRNILLSYTKAVVGDALTKAQDYISHGRFGKAEEIVKAAEQTVNKNRLYLGEACFKQYSSQLKRLAEKIVRERNRWFGNWDDRSAWRL